MDRFGLKIAVVLVISIIAIACYKSYTPVESKVQVCATRNDLSCTQCSSPLPLKAAEKIQKAFDEKYGKDNISYLVPVRN